MADWLPWRKKKADASAKAESVPETPRAEEQAVADSPREEVAPTQQSIWRRGLSRLRQSFRSPLERVLRGRAVDDELFTDLEEVLLSADVGVQETLALIERLRQRCQQERPADAQALNGYLKEEMLQLLQQTSFQPLQPLQTLVDQAQPWVILMVGINGVGKTTTVAKLAASVLPGTKKGSTCCCRYVSCRCE